MTAPLIWMPTLKVERVPPGFREWAIRRFLLQHGGLGHIIAPTLGLWPSLEVTEPQKGAHWYCRRAQKTSARTRPLDVTVEMPVPTHLNDPGLALLDQALAAGPLRRLVLTRPMDAPLGRLVTSVDTLVDSISAPVWLDLATFGWDAVAFLMARDERLQVAGVDDAALEPLERLAEILHRTVMMADLSGAPPQHLPRRNQYAQHKEAPRVLNSLPL
ncbi:MAG: hypothetical protein M1272_06860 [Firmicutes bacterium]|nr:hypothetical protein [Bacillota bacterium]